MNCTPLFFKKIFICGLIVFISVMHFSVSNDNAALHVLHRELYFIPILLTAFWFGLNSGLIVSLLIAFLYSSYVLTFLNDHVGMVTVIPQVIVFIIVGTLLGWLTEKRNKHRDKEIIDNNIIILGRAASAVAYEMKDILNALKSMFVHKAEGFSVKELNDNFGAELDRLSKMVDILSSYAKQEKGRIFSNNLNNIILERVEHFQKVAIENGITFATKLDPTGCPSWIDPNKISWVLDKLIENALEVSSSGTRIQISSLRNGKHCTLSVKDEGPGIKPENMQKIFSPFFTTKSNGQGLALAGCRKSLDSMGGKISVNSSLSKGTEFIIQVPREYKGIPLAEDTAQIVLKGHSDSQIYRE